MFSCAVGRLEHCKQISLACVGSARSVWTTLDLPQLTVVCAFLVCTAQAPGCSAGELSKAGTGLHALLRSKPLRFRFLGTPQRHRLSWACILCPRFVPFLGLNSSGDQVLGKRTFPRCGVSYHLPGSSRLFSWCAAASQVCLVSLLGC